MKKLLILSAILLGFFAATNAQSAIGARFNNGGELSYQTTAFGNRTEFDLGWSLNNEYVNGAVVYQFVKNIDGGLNWYYGVGGVIGLGNEIFLGVCGDLGIEYNFNKAPIQLSLDWRPTLGLIPSTDFGSSDVGLGIRYTF